MFMKITLPLSKSLPVDMLLGWLAVSILSSFHVVKRKSMSFLHNFLKKLLKVIKCMYVYIYIYIYVFIYFLIFLNSLNLF